MAKFIKIFLYNAKNYKDMKLQILFGIFNFFFKLLQKTNLTIIMVNLFFQQLL